AVRFVEARIVGEDLQLEFLERRPWLQAQLVHKDATALLVSRESVDLATGPIEREHELPAEPLALRVGSHEGLERRHRYQVAAERKVDVGAVLNRLQAQLLETGGLSTERWLVSEITQSISSPKSERFRQQARGMVE